MPRAAILQRLRMLFTDAAEAGSTDRRRIHRLNAVGRLFDRRTASSGVMSNPERTLISMFSLVAAVTDLRPRRRGWAVSNSEVGGGEKGDRVGGGGERRSPPFAAVRQRGRWCAHAGRPSRAARSVATIAADNIGPLTDRADLQRPFGPRPTVVSGVRI